VIRGLRLALTGRLGRRVYVAGGNCESEPDGDMAAGDTVMLGEREGLVSVAEAEAVALFVVMLGKFVRPGSAMPPWLCG
jgi:hypothetical protein